MPACSPQRYLANNLNAARTATLTPSDVEAVEDNVFEIPTGRSGTAQVALTGFYTGAEEATYDVEIVDDSLTDALISAPVFSGVGSGYLSDIASSGPAQQFTVSLTESGLPLRAASVDFEGVTLSARTAGAVGNDIFITVDQSTLTFTKQNYSLLRELPAGAGSEAAPLEGSEFDFDTAILGADNQIPAGAHRIAFGADTSAIYLQYKKYADGKWLYYFVPELKRTVPRGTVVNFVTGGRTVQIGDASPFETYENVETLYDLLNQIKIESLLVEITDPVANDRSPTGQAAHELVTRTDAHVEPSSGAGSTVANGFTDVSVDAAAGTELIIATCRAVTAQDDPLASVGRERWELKGSLSGDLGTIVTGEPFANDDFALTIPRVLPFGYGNAQKGRFTVTSIDYVARANGAAEAPPICPEALSLGPAAVDQSITLVYTKRPSGACLCDDMSVPNLNTACLGLFEEGGAEMTYSADAITRLKDLYDWANDLVTACTAYKVGYDFDGVPEQQASPLTMLGSGQAGTLTPAPTLVATRTFTGPNSTATATTSNELTVLGADNTIVVDNEPVTTGFADYAIPANFQECLDFYETGIAAIDAVTDGTLKSAGFAQWDLALDAFQADLDVSALSTLGNRLATIAIGKYKILVRQAMAYAGVPQLGKTDASTVTSGDGCWHDYGDTYYWAVVGSDKGAYAPAFNNKPYYSSRRASSQDAYFATLEFAFQINIKCPQHLLEGDTIVLSIGDAGWPATYQVGDELILAIIGASQLYLAGGQDSSLVQTWYVEGSVSGPLPSYSYDPDTPAPYSDGSLALLEFMLNEGGIPFANGDKFVLSAEGGNYRWRKNSGSWSASTPIPIAASALDSGLSIEFTPGAAPSFVAGDMFRFRALQPWAVSNLQSPTQDRWQWGAVTAPNVVCDLGTAQDLDMAAIALHTLPEGATIMVEGGTSPGAYPWSEALAWREGVIVGAFAATRNARYVRISLDGVDGGGIGWFWIGRGLSTELSANVRPRRKYAVSRASGGLYSSSRYLGKGKGADVEWTEGALLEADMTALEALLDWVKENDDEPFVFVPNVTRPADAMIVQVVEDEIEQHDTSDANRDAAFDRRFDARLSLAGVLQ